MRMGRVVIVFMIMALLIPSCFADEIEIPFALNTKNFKKDMRKNGIDLYGEKKSDGFVEDRGSMVLVYTYHTFPLEKLDILRNCATQNLRD